MNRRTILKAVGAVGALLLGKSAAQADTSKGRTIKKTTCDFGSLGMVVTYCCDRDAYERWDVDGWQRLAAAKRPRHYSVGYGLTGRRWADPEFDWCQYESERLPYEVLVLTRKANGLLDYSTLNIRAFKTEEAALACHDKFVSENERARQDRSRGGPKA